MKRKSKELKRIARDILNERYSIPMAAFATAWLIPTALRIPFSLLDGGYAQDGRFAVPKAVTALLAELLIMLISQILQAGVVKVHLNMTRAEKFKLIQMFDPLRFGAERYLGATLLLCLLCILCCLPLIAGTVYFYLSELSVASVVILSAAGILTAVACVLLSLNYNFVIFFLLDYPQMKVTAAFQECKRMMRGNKGRLFYVLASFAGYSVLAVLSFGIASLWIGPYQTQTLIDFYLDCTGELDRIPVPSYGTQG